MDNIESNVFPQRLRELRQRLSMTQKEFANKLGITASALSAYEKNTVNPSLSIVLKIAETFDVSLDWLCGRSDNEKTEFKLETYSDLFKLVLLFETNSKLAWSIYKDNSDYSILFFDQVINTMFYEWKKMRELLMEGSIDQEVYNLWIEKTIKKYNFAIKNDSPDLSDEDYPF